MNKCVAGHGGEYDLCNGANAECDPFIPLLGPDDDGNKQLTFRCWHNMADTNNPESCLYDNLDVGSNAARGDEQYPFLEKVFGTSGYINVRALYDQYSWLCKAGTYYKGGDAVDTCTTCPAGSVCPEDTLCSTGAESIGISSCGGGYTSEAGATSCHPATYKVTLDKQGGAGGTDAYWYTYNSSKTCYYFADAGLTKCIDDSNGQNITVPTRTGYTFGGYWTGKNGTGTQYVNASGLTINNLYKTTGDRTLYAKWQPNTIKVTLDSDGATSAGTTAYWYQYNTNNKCYYYSDAALTTCMGGTTANQKINTLPSKNGYAFGGYYTGKNGTGKQYITAAGYATGSIVDSVSSNITLYAKWTPVTMDCAAGQYLPAAKTACASCPAGYRCPNATTYSFSETTDQGATKCNKGTFATGGAKSCTTCAEGSYNTDGGATNCTACPVGTTTVGNVRSACDGTCPNADLTTAWKKPHYWNVNNTVPTLCKSAACAAGAVLANEGCYHLVRVTLDTQGGTAGIPAFYYAYQNYNDGGYYKDEKLTTEIAPADYMPTRTGYEFGGYYTEKNGAGDQIIMDIGDFMDEQMYKEWGPDSFTIYAAWTAKQIACAAGQYLPAGAEECKPCAAGNSCAGGTFTFSTTADQGLTPCAAGSFSAAGAKTCTACDTGSYTNAAGATACVPCQDGKTTSGTGRTSCDASCDMEHVAGWATAEWFSDNTTSACVPEACNDGYFISPDTLECAENSFVANFDIGNGEWELLGGGQPDKYIANLKYGEMVPDLWMDTMPKLDGYLFMGFFTEPNGQGEMYWNSVGRGVHEWEITEPEVEFYAYYEKTDDKDTLYYVCTEVNPDDRFVDLDSCSTYQVTSCECENQNPYDSSAQLGNCNKYDETTVDFGDMRGSNQNVCVILDNDQGTNLREDLKWTCIPDEANKHVYCYYVPREYTIIFDTEAGSAEKATVGDSGQPIMYVKWTYGSSPITIPSARKPAEDLYVERWTHDGDFDFAPGDEWDVSNYLGYATKFVFKFTPLSWAGKAIACDAGTYLPAGAEQCEVCPSGSYCPGGTYDRGASNDAGAESCPAGTYNGNEMANNVSQCHVCTDGKTSVAGAASCNIACTNATGAGTWKTPTLSNGTVSGLCVIDTCATGYVKVGNACERVVTLTLDANGGSTPAVTKVYMISRGEDAYEGFFKDAALTQHVTCDDLKSERTGYTFLAWGELMYVSAAGSCEFDTNEFFKNEDDMTISATWRANEYTVTFNANNGTGGASTVTVVYDATMTKLTSLPTRTGYQFAGYYDAATGGTMYYGADGTAARKWDKAANTTLYAQWVVEGEYTIGYELNGGTNAETNPGTYTVETETITLADPTRTGYTFGGWYSESTFATLVTQIAKGSTGNKMLYAKWTPIKYTIKYNATIGTGTVADTNCTYDEDCTIAANGFTNGTQEFTGWTLNPTQPVVQFQPGKVVRNLAKRDGAVLTMYARWVACTACVAGAGANCELTAPVGVCKYATSCRTGYDTPVNAGKYNPSCSVITYSITYNLDGGTNPADAKAQYTVETADYTLPVPSKKGYDFGGWFTNDAFTGGAVTKIARGSTGAKTFWAKFTPMKIHCNPGKYLVAGATVCDAVCPAGSMCAGGEVTYTGTEQGRSVCPAGTFSQAGANTCTKCLSGAFSATDGATACTPCAAGTTNDGWGNTKCDIQCANGAHVLKWMQSTWSIGNGSMGQVVAGECEIESCATGYLLGDNECVERITCVPGKYYDGTRLVPCPAGSYCPGGGETTPGVPSCATSCATVGDGSYNVSVPGASSAAGCTHKCDAYPIAGGVAKPVLEYAPYPTQCEFTGVSDTGNPCDIIDGRCVETRCNGNYELINGRCEPCGRDFALSYNMTAGNCIVTKCEIGYHPMGDGCAENTRECTIPGATSAIQEWNERTNSFGACIVTECDDGYHIASNKCVSDTQACTVANGTGTQEWNHVSNTWGACVATECAAGYTNEKTESAEPTRECGPCRNGYGVDGTRVASSYIRGCEIASCMYQGEMYNLENNECVPICSVAGYSDETGTMKWNPVTKKCDRTCADGYRMW